MTNMSNFKIERGIPLVNPIGKGRNKYPWADMRPDDSFFIPAETPEEQERVRNNVATAGRALERRGMRAAIRKVEGGVRVWAISRNDNGK